MTEERKDEKTEPAQTALPVEDGVKIALEAALLALENTPHWASHTILCILKTAVEKLRYYITKGEGGIDWKHPFVQLEYDLKPVKDEDVEKIKKRRWSGKNIEGMTQEDISALGKTFLDSVPIHIFKELTRSVIILPGDGGYNTKIAFIPGSDVEKEIADLPETEQEAKLIKLSAGWKLPDLKISGMADTPDGKRIFKFNLSFVIRPLHYYPEKRRAFYPIQVGLDFKEGDPAAWPEENREIFWTGLFKIIDDLSVPFLKELKDKDEEPAIIPEPDRAAAIRGTTFPVAAGFAPMHKVAERNPSGLLQYPEEYKKFHEQRTPLNWAVGLALFSVTSEKTPGDYQEISIKELEDRVFCLTSRNAQSRGDYKPDILAEVIKLHTVKNAFVRYDWEKKGRAWYRNIVLDSSYAIPNLGLVYLDKRGRRTLPSDPVHRDETLPLEVKGRRAYTPDGRNIKALPKDRYKLDRISWRWNPTFADDLKAAASLDAKNNIRRDAGGKILRGGFNIRIAVDIFKALFRLRAERAFLAHDLLILLSHDIYKPPKQSTAAGRNIIEREANRLFDLLGLEADLNHPERREEAVAGAIFRLKEKDIAALLPGSDERPRIDSNPQRRKGLYYRLVRSPAYTPKAALVTKEEAIELETAAVEDAAPILPPALPGPKAAQAVLPGMELPAAAPIPAGADIRAARDVAGVNLRDFAEAMKGPSFKTWSMIETGQRSASTGRIPEAVWQRVRNFIAQHKPKAWTKGEMKEP